MWVYPVLEDKLLVWKLRRAHVDALRRIYDKYKTDLLKLAVIMTRDVGQAEDVVQDVFLKLAQSYGRITIRGNLRNYLVTCLVNRVRSLRRRRGHRQPTEPDWTGVLASESLRPEHWAVLNEQMHQLNAALEHLPPEQREVITLRFEAGMGYRQVARIQNVSINTVQGRYRYGMEKLRSFFNGEVTE
jgi:RNA polymerase sigma factor (sigma-70 family)